MSKRPRSKPPKPKRDLGPVRVSVRLKSEPLLADAPEREPGVGLLADMAVAYQRGWKGSWTLSFGEARLVLRTPDHLALMEEFWVFLIELVDAGHGEWSLTDETQDLTVEAQVFGPDVQLEFTSGDGPPRYAGRGFPSKATVRLRALISEGTAVIRQFVTQAARMDPTLRERSDLISLLEDAGQLVEAVSNLPGTFRERGPLVAAAP